MSSNLRTILARSAALLLAAGLLSSCGGGGDDGGGDDVGAPVADPAPHVRAIVAYKPVAAAPADAYVRIGAAGLNSSVDRELYFERYGSRAAPACHTAFLDVQSRWFAQTRDGRFVYVHNCSAPALDKFDLLSSSIAPTRLPTAETTANAGFRHGPFLSADESTVSWITSVGNLDPNQVLFSFNVATNTEIPAKGIAHMLNVPYWFYAMRAVPGTSTYICESERSSGGRGGYVLDPTVPFNVRFDRLTETGADLEPYRTGEISQDGRFLRAAVPRRLANGNYEIWGYDLTQPATPVVLYTLSASSSQTLQRVFPFGDSSLLLVVASDASPAEVTLMTVRLTDGVTSIVATHPGYGSTAPFVGFVRGQEYLAVTGAPNDRAEVFAFDLAGLQPARRLTPSGGLLGISEMAGFGAAGLLVTHEAGRNLAFIRDTAPGILNPIGAALTATQAYTGAKSDPRGRVVVYSLTESGQNMGPAFAVAVDTPTVAYPLPGMATGEYAIVRQVLDAT
jgi:hypothetical protein